MSTLSIKSRNTKSGAPKKGSAQSKTASRRKVPAATAKKPTRSVESKAERVAAAKTLRKADELRAERVTKQERVLTLLSQPNGASIVEMMQATDWQHVSALEAALENTRRTFAIIAANAVCERRILIGHGRRSISERCVATFA
jgi:hypothetical protein